MLIEIIIGAVIGSGLMGGVYWLNTRNKNKDETSSEENEIMQGEQQRTLDHKLRNAIADCERSEQVCIDELQQLYLRQAELLDTLGKPSYIFVENKPCAFAMHNPISGEYRYYYERDLLPNPDVSIKDKIMALVQQYQEHINLLIAKIELCRKLKTSHQDNLARLDKMSNENSQLSKIKEHENRLQDSNSAIHRIERDSIYQGLQLGEIEEELSYQEECLRQYKALNEKYSLTPESLIPAQLQQELKRLMEHIEDEDDFS